MTPVFGMQSGYDRLDSPDPSGMGVCELVCSISCFGEIQLPAALMQKGRSILSRNRDIQSSPNVVRLCLKSYAVIVVTNSHTVSYYSAAASCNSTARCSPTLI